MQTKINGFMDKNKALFDSRIADKRVRDCHGDLHSGNIFITDKICIFDAIEFNDRFRYSDVAADVAFLAMDLDYQNRSDLADYFISTIPRILQGCTAKTTAALLQVLPRLRARQSHQLQTRRPQH